MLHGLSKVVVDQEDFLSVLRHGEGDIRYGGGFAFSRNAGGKGDVFQLFARAGELDVRADDAVGFRLFCTISLMSSIVYCSLYVQ